MHMKVDELGLSHGESILGRVVDVAVSAFAAGRS